MWRLWVSTRGTVDMFIGPGSTTGFTQIFLLVHLPSQRSKSYQLLVGVQYLYSWGPLWITQHFHCTPPHCLTLFIPILLQVHPGHHVVPQYVLQYFTWINKLINIPERWPHPWLSHICTRARGVGGNGQTVVCTIKASVWGHLFEHPILEHALWAGAHGWRHDQIGVSCGSCWEI